MSKPEFKPTDAVATVERLAAEARRLGATDLHLTPRAGDCRVQMRVDGMLQDLAPLPGDAGRAVIARLMVLARLLTYRMDVPQEGRARLSHDADDARVSVIPTTLGPRCAVRFSSHAIDLGSLDRLQLPAHARDGLADFLRSGEGLLLVIGPAGSGKTTTLYATLAQLAREHPDTSIVSIEDPVERTLDGVAQVEVTPFGELTYERALRSVLRQDPQVLALGEIREAATATLAVQAALSGHRLLCTLHARSVGGAIARLLEMGIEPYQITASLRGVLNQRLLRRRTADGYAGRLPVAEFARLDAATRRLVLDRADADSLDASLRGASGFVSLRRDADRLLQGSLTDEAEIARMLSAEDGVA